MDKIDLEADAKAFHMAELLDRIAALELRVAQLEARPQPAQPIGGAGNWPWPTQTYPWWSHLVPSADGTLARVTVTGDNVSRETPLRSSHSVCAKGMNGPGGTND